MNYKETLFFISQCLTINFEEKNNKLILLKLKSKQIDWDRIVKICTENYVLPTFYCNLKRANFLKYLPKELVLFMKEITNLNRNRNIQIIAQAKKINTLLLSNNISPIFLKGTGNLLAQLYIDIAERMVGDIDFILSKEDYLKGIKVLRKYGYSDVIKQKYHLPSEKHYRRIIKKQNIAAVEIHNNLLSAKYAGEFNFDKIEKDRQMINNFMVLSYEDKLNLSILSNQINDYGFYYKTISLRNAYDVFLLSKKTNAKKCPSKFNKLKDPINCFLAICYLAFGEVNSLKYNKSKKTERYLSDINKLLLNDRKRKSSFKLKYIKLIIRDRLSILYKSLFQKDYRNWVINRIFEKI